ncbi:hypothetical protein [Altererythrobacter fulvus]|uniref:hypothetical protein n=1 Tax=Caenibius fulvus TaxID=2126012 RepID=UPI00301946FF
MLDPASAILQINWIKFVECLQRNVDLKGVDIFYPELVSSLIAPKDLNHLASARVCEMDTKNANEVVLFVKAGMLAPIIELDYRALNLNSASSRIETAPWTPDVVFSARVTPVTSKPARRVQVAKTL